MRLTFPRALLACLAILLARTASAEEATFKPLFDGRTLDGWKVQAEKQVPDDQWTAKDAVLAAKAGWSWLSTTREYGDFVLRLKWRIPENGNSGVFIRVPVLAEKEQPHEKGIEIQVLDDKGSEYVGKLKPWQYTGSIYDAVPAENSTFKGAGQWNEYEITCRGERIEVKLNGKLVSAANMSEHETLKARPRKGFIGLQNHGSAVEYKEIEIKVLE